MEDKGYLKIIKKHLVEKDIIIPKGIMTINDIIYSETKELFSPIIIDSDFINSEYYNKNESKEVVNEMLVEYIQDFINDTKQKIKII